MFDGVVLSERPGHQMIYMNPEQFNKPTGHFESPFCWCQPTIIPTLGLEGELSTKLGHQNIIYRFSEDMKPCT